MTSPFREWLVNPPPSSRNIPCLHEKACWQSSQISRHFCRTKHFRSSGSKFAWGLRRVDLPKLLKDSLCWDRVRSSSIRSLKSHRGGTCGFWRNHDRILPRVATKSGHSGVGTGLSCDVGLGEKPDRSRYSDNSHRKGVSDHSVHDGKPTLHSNRVRSRRIL